MDIYIKLEIILLVMNMYFLKKFNNKNSLFNKIEIFVT